MRLPRDDGPGGIAPTLLRAGYDGRGLAILGAPPAFIEPVHVGRPNIADTARLLARFKDVLESRWLTNRGPRVREFEAEIASRVGTRHCVAMCNATVALEIVTRALGMEGEVIVPSMTFVATAHSLQWQRITPVFCDIDASTHQIDWRRAEELITPRTTGIVAVHLWGRSCDVEDLEALAKRHRLALVFDAAHAFGCTHKGRPVGGFGNAEVFSFHATKVVNSFEGGAVTTNDDKLAEKLRLMQNFGFAGYDNVVHVGTNGKMTEIAAAMGLESIAAFEQFVAINRRNFAVYRDAFREMPGIRFFEYDEAEANNYHYVVIEVDPDVFGLNRDELLKVLHAENVLARRYFWPGVHRMEPYRSYFPNAGLLLPQTTRLLERVLVLPTGTAMGQVEVEACAGIVGRAGPLAAEVRAALVDRR